MKLADFPALRDAPLSAKLDLLEELSADIAAAADRSPLPESHVHALNESMAEYHQNPREGRPWPELRDALLGKKK